MFLVEGLAKEERAFNFASEQVQKNERWALEITVVVYEGTGGAIRPDKAQAAKQVAQGPPHPQSPDRPLTLRPSARPYDPVKGGAALIVAFMSRLFSEFGSFAHHNVRSRKKVILIAFST